MSRSRGTLPSSVALAAEKARASRMQRLRTALDTRIESSIATLDALVAELGEGEAHPDLWEKLHAASVRDGIEADLADAYGKTAVGARMRKLSPDAQAAVLMHAADYLQGVRGDPALAEPFLDRVVQLVPSHAEAFVRLERRYEKQLDPRKLLELYAAVAATPPRLANVLAAQALNTLQLHAKTPFPDEGCKKLLALVPALPRLLDALEAHCRATKRAPLACTLLEEAIADPSSPEDLLLSWRRRLVELCVGDAAMPARAIDHLEKLLEVDPTDPAMVKVAERLLSERDVASRAAAALQQARRSRRT